MSDSREVGEGWGLKCACKVRIAGGYWVRSCNSKFKVSISSTLFQMNLVKWQREFEAGREGGREGTNIHDLSPYRTRNPYRFWGV